MNALILSPKICSFLPPCASSPRSAWRSTVCHCNYSDHSLTLHLKGSMSESATSTCGRCKRLAGERQPASRGLSAAAVHADAGHVAASVFSAFGGGPRVAADAGCQSGEVASGTYDVVLRDFRVVAVHAGFPAVSSRLSQSCSIPTTTPLATGLCEPCGTFCRDRVWMRFMPIALCGRGDGPPAHVGTSARGDQAD